MKQHVNNNNAISVDVSTNTIINNCCCCCVVVFFASRSTQSEKKRQRFVLVYACKIMVEQRDKGEQGGVVVTGSRHAQKQSPSGWQDQ
jgi:hypothetical protein